MDCMLQLLVWEELYQYKFIKIILVATNDGNNLKLKLTGNQKQVMRESVDMCIYNGD